MMYIRVVSITIIISAPLVKIKTFFVQDSLENLGDIDFLIDQTIRNTTLIWITWKLIPKFPSWLTFLETTVNHFMVN